MLHLHRFSLGRSTVLPLENDLLPSASASDFQSQTTMKLETLLSIGWHEEKRTDKDKSTFFFSQSFSITVV